MSGFSKFIILALAQGLGTGRAPKTPGTFGTLLGIPWFVVLLVLAHLNVWFAVAVFAASLVIGAWVSEAAEKLLGEHDPGSVVIDEILAIPTCFIGWVVVFHQNVGVLPTLDFFFAPSTLPLLAGVFLVFRFFDIAKPWPVEQSQSLPRGWGVMLDDQLAAVYVNVVMLVVHAFVGLTPR